MKLNFKQAVGSLFGRSRFMFVTRFLGGKIIDSSPYNRSQLVSVYETGIESRTVIDRYVSGFTSIPIKLVDNEGVEVSENWRLDLLKNPNKLQTQKQFESDCALQWAIFNEYFIHGGTMEIGLNQGRPEFLKTLPGQYVGFELDVDGSIIKYVNTCNNSISLDNENVKPVIGNILDPEETFHATSKLITATKVTKKLDQAHDNEINSFANSGVGGLISAKGEDTFTKEQHDNFIERLNDSSKTNGLEFTSAAIDYNQIKRTPVDLGVLESSENGRKALALVYNIPLALISEDASTRDNVTQGERSFALNVLIPDKELFCEKLTEFLDGKKDNVKFVVDMDKVKQIQKNDKDVQDTYDQARASVNERRQALGLELLDGEEWNRPLLKINDQIGIAPDFSPTDLGVE